MINRGVKLKQRQRALGLKDGEVAKAIPEGSIDTIRKLGKINLSDQMLDLLEAGIEKAKLNRIKRLQSTG